MEINKKVVKLTNGETIAYLEKGSGDYPLILIHGNLSSSVHYLPLLNQFEENQHVIALDLRGFGDSSYKKGFDSLHELAEDVALFIKALKLKTPLAVAGWSAGGGVALSLASKKPQLVDKVILINSMSYRGMPVYKKDEKGAPILTAFYKTKEELALDPIQVLPIQNAIVENNRAFMEYVWDLAIYNLKKPSREDYDLYLDETFKQRCLIDLDWALTQFNIGIGPNYYGLPGDRSIVDLKAKVLSIHSAKDLTVPEFMVRETVGALAKKARMITYKNSGHSPLVDNPVQLGKDILAFLAE